MKNKKAFTLLELLVVVLIIGILAGIALPQYQMAVTKAKVASILPLMRRWKDAMQEYKLQHGSYEDLDSETGGADLGVTWPSDWKKNKNGLPSCDDYTSCVNDYWECGADLLGEGREGSVSCWHEINSAGDAFTIIMNQPDNGYFPNKIICYAEGNEGHKVCKALGGKITENGEDYILY